ncbi:MAG: dTDP-4-dehydrorhamnose reductase [Flavobacteriales bacterium]
MKILVTGANGQLGRCIKDAASKYPEQEFFFANRQDLDIENKDQVSDIFKKQKFDFCINTAAYTNVEKAESQSKQAFAINAEAVKQLAQHCKNTNTTLIHISTDYVFDGNKTEPYLETDLTNPINVYGESKLKGEQYIQEICERFFILRTSWLYSQYGHNFYKSILQFAKEGKELKITTEQTGTPTNANDLAQEILHIIKCNNNKYGIYNVSNAGEATWYDFAKEILLQTNQINTINLAKTNYYRTFAKRPTYSVLDTNKFKNTFEQKLISWQESLIKVLNN